MKHLFYTPNTPPAFLDRVKAVKPRVLPDEQVQPHKAVPGSPGRILAYGEAPSFACDYALVNANTTDEGLEAALSHVLGLSTHPRGVSMAQWLSGVFGARVVEVNDGVPAFR